MCVFERRQRSLHCFEEASKVDDVHARGHSRRRERPQGFHRLRVGSKPAQPKLYWTVSRAAEGTPVCARGSNVDPGDFLTSRSSVAASLSIPAPGTGVTISRSIAIRAFFFSGTVRRAFARPDYDKTQRCHTHSPTVTWPTYPSWLLGSLARY
jgi:hypothetical protein